MADAYLLEGRKSGPLMPSSGHPVSSRRPKLYRPRKIVKKRMKSLKEVLEQIHELRMPSRRNMMQIGSVWNERRQRR
jgi:hypothetical protein